MRGFSEPWTPVCVDRLRNPCLPAGMPVPIPKPAELEPEASTQARLGSLCGGPRQQAGTSSPVGQRVPSPCHVGRARVLVERDGGTSASLGGGQRARTHLSPRSRACPHMCCPRACVCRSLRHTRVSHTPSAATGPLLSGCQAPAGRWAAVGLWPDEACSPERRATQDPGLASACSTRWSPIPPQAVGPIPSYPPSPGVGTTVTL